MKGRPEGIEIEASGRPVGSTGERLKVQQVDEALQYADTSIAE
jgi:hypothetical protein